MCANPLPLTASSPPTSARSRSTDVGQVTVDADVAALTSGASRVLDELMADAWPTTVDERHAGWRLRWANGVTRRANSAWALGGATTDEQIQRAERFFGERGLPSRILVSSASSPTGLGVRLTERGYVGTAHSLVATAEVPVVLGEPAPARDPDPGLVVDVDDRLSDAWFDTFWSIEAGPRHGPDAASVYRTTLLVPELPTGYAAVRDGGRIVGVGQVVVNGDWGGVQCMATAAGYRRRGVAGAVLRGLTVRARELGATRMYLAVMASNLGARRVYERHGFRIAHEYHYWQRTA